MRISKKSRLIAFVIVVVLLITLTAGITMTLASDTLKAYEATVEYMENPLGIGRQDPVFSWKISKGATRSISQASYQITVKTGSSTVWDSGVVQSSTSNGIVYDGDPLKSGTHYSWNVNITDSQGANASTGGTFGTGLLDEGAWEGAKWISNTGGTPGSEQSSNIDPKKYSIECEFEMRGGSLGLMFGNDTNNFYMWQLNTVQSQINRDETNLDNIRADDVLMLRPHVWVNGGGRCLSEYEIGDSEAIKALRTGTHKVKLEVDNGKVWLYIDGNKVTYEKGLGTTQKRTEDYLELSETALNQIGGAGFRVCYTPSNLDKDDLTIKKLTLYNSEKQPVYYDDFTGYNSLTYGTIQEGGGLLLKPEAQTSGWLTWQKEADEKVYSLQTDVQVLNQAAGLVLGAKDSSHFYMWQLNTFDYPTQGAANKLTYLRPHVWNGGPTEYGNDINVNDIISKADAEGKLNSMRVDVNDGKLTTYLNKTKVDERTSTQKFAIGNIGFRMAKDSNSANPEKAAFDNVMLRDAGGRVIYYDDFENDKNPYGAGSIVNGALHMAKEGAQDVYLRDNSASGNQSKVPLMMKEFKAENKEIARATVYASALGHYELNLNGAKIGEQYMAPGWTEYASRVQYQTYDVTSQIQKNEKNRIGAMIAPGWYSGNISILGPNRYGETQSLIANLIIEYTDGTKQSVVTDETWKYSMDGPITITDMFNGESYDATREQGNGKYGWTEQSYDASDWGTVGVAYKTAYGAKTQGKSTALSAQIGEGVTKIREVNPQSVTEVAGKWIVDMGQNFAGILELSLKGKTGETAKIRYGEMLNDSAQGVRGCDNPDGAGSIYTANLRTAKATDRYTFKTDSKETWEPNFTFHGFRYVEISGCEKPSTSDIKGFALASVSKDTGSFTSSDNMLNSIYKNSVWGQYSNFLSIPTDCPQRDERMGWGADTHVFSRTGIYNMDANMFYQKWLQDVRDGQYANGGYGNTAPNPHGFENDVVWAAGGVIVPYDIWQMTGDTRILKDSYESMKKYMSSRTKGGLIQACGYGDWLEPVDGTSNKDIIGTTYLAYQYSLMAEIADALQKPADAESYRAKFEAVKTEFNNKFVKADGTIAGNSGAAGIQSYYVLALGIGLATPQTEPLFAQKLAEKIVSDGSVMSVGFVSVNKLMPILSKYGYNDIAYMLATSTKYPSWGYSVAQGASTMWERWNSYTLENGFGPVNMNSFNHYSFGSVCEWFYSGIAGIKTDKTAPGFENVIIEPELDTRLQNTVTSASASYDSIRGKVSSGWSLGANNKVTLKVSVPANATATLLLPTDLATVSEGSGILAKALLDGNKNPQVNGVASAGYSEDTQKAEIKIGSGDYEFNYEWKAPVVKTELETALKTAMQKVEVYEDYTDDSVLALRNATLSAQNVYDDAEATAEQVIQEITALNAAITSLAPSNNVNLVASKSATASSQISAGNFAAKNLTDGTRSGGGETAWSSQNEMNKEYHNEWVQIDLGAEKEFNRLLIFPRNDPSDPGATGKGFPRDFTVEISSDGHTWETVVARSNYPSENKFVDAKVQRFSMLKKTARYIKVDMTRINITEASNHRAQLGEIELYNLATAIGKAELKELIDQASLKEKIEYTIESFEPFETALESAKVVYANDTATAIAIETAYSALNTAMSNLKAPEYANIANWIWDTKTAERGTWSAFRKTLDLNASDITAIAGQQVNAQIAADSKYWLYINGELVVYEGSLKRGPNPQDTYVDTVDIAPYLKEGKNVISALVWHFGAGDWYSHRESGQAGFYFDAKINNTPVISNQSFKTINYDAYKMASQQPNARLPENSILFDARLEQTGWLQEEFDDSSWQNAQVFGKKGVAPWNDFVERPIPMFAYDDYVTFDMNNVVKEETPEFSTIRTIADEQGKPIADYVLETKFTVDSGAFGVVFGHVDGNNLNMWQIFGSTPSSPNTGSPKVKPHIKNGGWDVRTAKDIDAVSNADMFTHEYNIKLIVENNEVTTYVDGVSLGTETVTNTKGGIGFRADKQSIERGSVEYIKVTSLDGNTTYYEDNFDDATRIDKGTVADGKLKWDGASGELAMSVSKQKYVQYTAKLPTNFQFTPYFVVDATAGETIRISTDKTKVPDGPGVMAEYITKNGEQSYESLGWMNGDKLIFQIPSDVNVKALGYRKSGYPTTFDGSFTSDDEFLNTLWIKARDTLYVTMRDNYMDCPDRERAQWWGDAVNEMEMAFYALSPDSSLLAKKGIQNVLGFVKDDIIPTVAPIGNRTFYELPAQSMAGIMSFYMYYEYTGDSSLFADAYPASVNYLLKKFSMGTDGVVQHRTGSWDWSDWGANSDQKLVSNLWYYIALDRSIKMAEVLGVAASDADLLELQNRKNSIALNFDKVFWNVAGFYRTPGVGVTDDRGNALAVYAGIASQDKYEDIRNVLMTSKHSSPYMEKYALEALYLMNFEDDALTRMKERYKEMVESELTTLWEFWNPTSGTQNHAWTGGPLTLMGRYATGVAPTKPGFSEFSVKPQIGTIKKIDTVVPTIHGDITVNIDATQSGKLNLATTVPTGTKALVGVPLIGGKDATTVLYNGNAVWVNGENVVGAAIKSISLDERYVYFEANSDISFTAERGEVSALRVDIDDKENISLFVDGVEKTMPYQYALYAKDKKVELRFVPKYVGEFEITELTEQDNKLTFKPEEYMAIDVTMEQDYTITGKVSYVGLENLAAGKTVTADNAMSGTTDPGWGANNLVDNIRTSQPGKSGFTTREYLNDPVVDPPHTITIDLGASTLVNSLYLYPRTDAATKEGKHPCYPEDFVVEISEDAVTWKEVVVKVGEIVPQNKRGEYKFELQSARYIRIATSKLGEAAADESSATGTRYRLQLAEIEVYGETRSAQTVADSITALVAPEKDATTLTPLVLPEGFSYAIKSSSNEGVVALDGTIIPPENDTAITLVYEITRKDGDKANTSELSITVPGMTATPIVITAQPQDASHKEGETAIFNVEVTGTYPHYQWQKQLNGAWIDVVGATTASYTTDTLYVTDNGAKIRCAITNNATQTPVYSNEVSLAVVLGLPTAKEIADAITAVTQPTADQKQLAIPGVAPGFSIAIAGVVTVPIDLSGVITPPDAETVGTVQFKVVRIADGSEALTANLPVTVPGKTVVAPGTTAQNIADGITTLTAPSKDSTALVLPGVPEGFSMQIASVTPEGVLAADGTIIPPEADTQLSVVLNITNTSDVLDPVGVTTAIAVTIPAKTSTTLQTPTIITLPTAGEIIYGQKLESSILTGGQGAVTGSFAWKDKEIIPNAGNQGCKAIFTPVDGANYKPVEVTIALKVNKATPVLASLSVEGLEYGHMLNAGKILGTVKNPNNGEIVAGTLSWQDDGAITRAINADKRNVSFVPNDLDSYEATSGQLEVTIKTAVPNVVVSVEPQEQLAGQEVNVQVVVNNPHDATYLDNLPIPVIKNVELIQNGNTYTGKYTIPVDAEADARIMFEANTPEVAEMYKLGRGQGFVTVVKPQNPDDKEIVEVTLDDNKKISADILRQYAGKNVYLNVNYGGYSWRIDASTIAGDIDPAGYDLATTVVTEAYISALTGGKELVQLSIAHNGNLPFEATLSFPIGAEQNGKTTHIYYVDEQAGKLVHRSSVSVVDGFAEYKFTTCSKYVISIEQLTQENPTPPTQPTSPTPQDTTGESKNKVAAAKTGDTTNMMMWIIMTMGATAVMLGVVVYKNRKVKQNK